MATGTSRSIVDRMRGAAMLDVPTYEEVEHDTTATGQAAVVVVLAGLASAIGAWRYGGEGILGALIAAVLGWLIWSGITYVVGTRLFGGTATWGELLRTLGFAQAPGLLLVAAIVPILGWLVRIVVSLWLLATGFIAIRQALDVDNGKAFLTAIVAWLAGWVCFAIIAGITGIALR